MEKASDIMIKNPYSCFTETPLQEVANMMVKFDVGEIPVVDQKSGMIAGIITDRDICCRTVAEGLNPLEMRASEVMTVPAITVHPEASLVRCIQLMERNHIRRIPVVDEHESICGIISLEDIAAREELFAAEIMKELSKTKTISLQ